MKDRFTNRRPLTARLAFWSFLCLAARMCAQTTTVPETPSTAVPQRTYDSSQMAQRAYDDALPKPIFPSTPRVQKQFAVRYIYDYALSTYTPPKTLPRVTRAQADRTTPEGAMIAMTSAMQNGDYEGWLQCWDAPAQKTFAAQAKELKRDAAFWKKAWEQFYGGKDVVLVDRLEVVGYIILDARVTQPGRPNEGVPYPTIFKHVNGQWLATNDLSTSTFLGSYQPGIAGVDNRVSPQPMVSAQDAGSQEAEAQGEFLRSHALVTGVTRAGK